MANPDIDAEIQQTLVSMGRTDLAEKVKGKFKNENGELVVSVLDQSTVTGFPWTPTLMKQATLFVPDFLYKNPTDAKPDFSLPGDEPTVATGENAAMNRKWSYQYWSCLCADLKNNKLMNHLNYYCALHLVTKIFGRPWESPLVYITDKYHKTPFPSDMDPANPELADYGYAIWILGVRLAAKSNMTFSEDTSMFRSMESFLKTPAGKNIQNDVTQLAGLIRNNFQQGTPHLQSEVIIRRGMNITKEFYVIATPGQPVKFQRIPDGLEVGSAENGYPIQNTSRKLDIYFIEDYKPDFWAFAQIGFYRAAYSAMEQIRSVLEKRNKKWKDVWKYFNTNYFLTFMATCIAELGEMQKDPWRSVSYSIAKGVIMPLSSQKWPDISYIGSCMNAEELDDKTDVKPVPGVKIVGPLKILIRDKVIQMFLDWGVNLIGGGQNEGISIFPKMEIPDTKKLLEQSQRSVPASTSTLSRVMDKAKEQGLEGSTRGQNAVVEDLLAAFNK